MAGILGLLGGDEIIKADSPQLGFEKVVFFWLHL